MKAFISLFFAVLSVGFSFAQKMNVQEEILHVMQSQQRAWNNGDIDGFMQIGYWHSDSLQFVGTKSITYGWQKTLDNYKKAYPNKLAMGVLNFSVLQIQQLSENACFVIGAWHLSRV